MAQYSFVTLWRVRAPIDRVWDAIQDYQGWSRWWPGVSARPVSPGGPDRVGEVNEFLFDTPLRYRLRFRMRVTAFAPPRVLDGRSVGDLEGIGRFRLVEADDETFVLYTWDVQTNRRWMNVLAPALRPAFAWNHDRVMKRGGDGLKKLLEGHPVAAPSTAGLA